MIVGNRKHIYWRCDKSKDRKILKVRYLASFPKKLISFKTEVKNWEIERNLIMMDSASIDCVPIIKNIDKKN